MAVVRQKESTKTVKTTYDRPVKPSTGSYTRTEDKGPLIELQHVKTVPLVYSLQRGSHVERSPTCYDYRIITTTIGTSSTSSRSILVFRT